MLVTRDAGLHLDALLSSPSSFLSAGAESAAQHPVNACCMLREVMRGHHEISFHQSTFESSSTMQSAHGLERPLVSETVSMRMLWHSNLTSKIKML